MPDDQHVPAGGAGQTHPARVRFASDAVREKIGDLLAEAGGTLAAVNEDERQHVASRLRKAKGAAPLNLLPLLTLLLAACGKAAPDIAGRPDAEDEAEEDRSKEDDERAGPPGEILSAETSSDAGSAGDDVSGGWRFVKASTRAGKPPMSPEAEANMVRLCLQAITDNSLQASAIHEICSLIDLAAQDEKFTAEFVNVRAEIAAQDERFDIKLSALEDRLNGRITCSQLATIIILTAVMGAFNIWG